MRKLLFLAIGMLKKNLSDFPQEPINFKVGVILHVVFTKTDQN